MSRKNQRAGCFPFFLDTLFNNNFIELMDTIPKKYFKEFISAVKQVADLNLVICGSGNLSWRIDRARMLITATGAWMSEMTEDEIAVCGIADGVSLNKKEPSIETGLHGAIFKERSEVNVVLHFQSLYATTIACSEKPDRDFFVIPEIPYYIGSIGIVPYKDPGSANLVKAVTSAIRRHSLLILENHGQIATGRDFREVIQKAAFLEFASGIILQAGNRVKTLSEEAVIFLANARNLNAQRGI